MTPFSALPGPTSSRRVIAESISSSPLCELRSGASAVPVLCSCASLRRASAAGRLRPSTSATAARVRATAAARSARLADSSALSTTAMPSERPPNSSCTASLTVFDSLPGTSKPPPVRLSVWCMAIGRAARRTATQPANTQRR